MTSHMHHLSFTDYLSLYLPHFLRPDLPRDLRPPPQPQPSPPPRDIPSPPPPTPERSGSREREKESGDEERRGMTSSSLHEEEKQERRSRSRKLNEALRSKTNLSREGYHVALILTNSGSVARDHLASERTFLAYVRTSLALASTGVALVQLFTIANNTGTWHPGSSQQQLVRHFATPIGSTMIVLGLAVLLLGCQRYFAIQTALTRGVFPAARLTVMFIVVTLAVITGLVFGVLIRSRSGT